MLNKVFTYFSKKKNINKLEDDLENFNLKIVDSILESYFISNDLCFFICLIHDLARVIVGPGLCMRLNVPEYNSGASILRAKASEGRLWLQDGLYDFDQGS
jgi:hypothetical protein